MPKKTKPLSGAPVGNGVIQLGDASPGTEVHTATGVTSDDEVDEIWLWASNTSVADVVLTLEVGGTGVANEIDVTVPANGAVPVLQGHPVNNGIAIAGYAATASVVNVYGFVERNSQ